MPIDEPTEAEKQGYFDFDASKQSDPLGAMTLDRIYEIADQEIVSKLVENRRFERKTATVSLQEIGNCLSITSNTPPEGGLIAIGVEDDGTLSGCNRSSQEHLNDLERAGDTHCADAIYRSKPVSITNAKGERDTVLLLRVQYSPNRLVENNRGEAFVRRGQSRHRLTEDEKREMKVAMGEIALEQEPCGLSYPEDFDQDWVKQFATNFRKAGNIGAEVSDQHILESRRLGRMKDGAFIANFACAAVFAFDPVRIIPGCKIRFLRFDGDEEGTGKTFNAIKDVTFEGNIPTLIQHAEKFIEGQMREFSRLGDDGKFWSAPEYPKEAWFEAVVNACVHRSYNLKNMNIFVKMFDSRLVIESPGAFPPLVTSENIYYMHQPRNPHMMEALRVLNLVKCVTEGTNRMRRTMKQMNLPAPEFIQERMGNTMVRVTLRNNISARRTFMDADAAKVIGETIFSTLTDHEKRVINFIAEHSGINVSQAQRLTALSWPAAKKMLATLRTRGILEHIHKGSGKHDPQAHYKLKKRTGDRS